MNHDERDELAALYALGVLDGDELEVSEKALLEDPAFRKLVAAYEESATQLAAALPVRKAPDTLRRKVLMAAQEQRARQKPVPTEFSFAWAPWALAAALAVYCGISVTTSSRLGKEQARLESEKQALDRKVLVLVEERDELKGQVTALLQEKADLDMRVASYQQRDPLREIENVSLAAQAEAPDKNALTALWDPARQAGVLDLTKLPAPPADKDYQLWIIPAGSPTPLDGGILTAAVGARAVFEAPLGVAQVGALAISLEPKGGSIAARGPIIYLGEM